MCVLFCYIASMSAPNFKLVLPNKIMNSEQEVSFSLKNI